MTLLKIEVKTVTGKYHPEDMVKIWAPALRANGDAVVSTAPEIVKLVQGQAEVELIPGPARIQIMCGGTLDNAVRKVTIPDAATATLRTVLEDGFDWEPQIVTEVMRYRNEAVAASTSAAEDAADAATSATNAAASASAAATSAQSASSSKTAASTSASKAATSATNAATSASEAATSASASATSASASATSAQAAAASKTAASTSASNASTSATNAAASASEAATSATASATSAGEAGSSATDAATSAGSAAASETAASTSATNAATSATNAATSAGEAATHEDTSLDAAAAAIAAAVSVAQFQGHGFPNGQVAAPVGSIYTDLDATAGAIRWIKTSGTGNTGWKVEYGDTGWRDITSLLPGSTGLMLLRRTGNVVEYALNNFDNSAGTQANFSLPSGFWAGKTTHTIISDTSPQVWTLATNGYVSFGQRNVNGSKHGVWTTPDPWPTTLPGTPA